MPKANKTSDHLQQGLLERRTVVLSGEITPESMTEVSQKLLALQLQGNDPINLIIDSGGGSIYAALYLCDIITHVMTAPVHGIAIGGCGSAATFVMLHCAKRLSTPHSMFLIHSGSRSEITIPINQTTSDNLLQLLKETKDIEELVLKMYINRLTPACWNNETKDSKKRKFVRKLIDRGDQSFNEWMTAHEAVTIGLIGQVITEKLSIFTE